MKRLIIPIALLGLMACGEDDPKVVYRTMPTSTAQAVAQQDDDVRVLDIVWPSFRDEICGTINDLGGLTPELEQFGVDEFNKGYDGRLSAAGEAHLRRLMRGC